jgi:hypothetical protein
MKEIEQFHSLKDYERYLEMRYLALSINRLIKRGFLVLDQRNRSIRRFLFKMDQQPGIWTQSAEHIYESFIDHFHPVSGKLTVRASEKKRLEHIIESLKLVIPEYITNLKGEYPYQSK